MSQGAGAMKVGVPKEVKNNEYRVAITPAGVHELARNGHEVFIEAGAGIGSSLPDSDFTAARAEILSTADEGGATRGPIFKGKGPVAGAHRPVPPGHVPSSHPRPP